MSFGDNSKTFTEKNRLAWTDTKSLVGYLDGVYDAWVGFFGEPPTPDECLQILAIERGKNTRMDGITDLHRALILLYPGKKGEILNMSRKFSKFLTQSYAALNTDSVSHGHQPANSYRYPNANFLAHSHQPANSHRHLNTVSVSHGYQPADS